MTSARHSQHRLALLSVLLLLHSATSAHLKVADNEDFDVFTAIQTQVNNVNTNLDALSKAVDDNPAPGPSTTEEPSPVTSDSPALNGEAEDVTARKLRHLRISRNFLTLEVDPRADSCQQLTNIVATVETAQGALDLVSDKQLSNDTLTKLKNSNTDLSDTTKCVNDKKIIVDDADAVKTAITAAEKTGEEASDTIDNIVSPPTPTPPEDYSGFKSATIALGVLFSLALIAVAGLAIYVHRQNSG